LHSGVCSDMTDIAAKIGRTIRLIRTRRGLTQGQLAERAKLSVSYLSLIEQGKRNPGLDAVEAVADALDVPLNIVVFLATDVEELEGFDRETAEKLSLLAWKIIDAKAEDERAVISK